jgi:hypothetical protein
VTDTGAQKAMLIDPDDVTRRWEIEIGSNGEWLSMKEVSQPQIEKGEHGRTTVQA